MRRCVMRCIRRGCYALLLYACLICSACGTASTVTDAEKMETLQQEDASSLAAHSNVEQAETRYPEYYQLSPDGIVSSVLVDGAGEYVWMQCYKEDEEGRPRISLERVDPRRGILDGVLLRPDFSKVNPAEYGMIPDESSSLKWGLGAPVNTGGALPQILAKLTYTRKTNVRTQDDGTEVYNLESDILAWELCDIGNDGTVTHGIPLNLDCGSNESLMDVIACEDMLLFHIDTVDAGATGQQSRIVALDKNDGSYRYELVLPENEKLVVMGLTPKGMLLLSVVSVTKDVVAGNISWGDTGHLYLVDPTAVAPELGEAYPHPEKSSGFLGHPQPVCWLGESDTEDIWLVSGNGAYIWDSETNIWSLRYDFIGTGVDMAFKKVFGYSPETIFVLETVSDTARLVSVGPVAADIPDGRLVVTVASTGNEAVAEQAAVFNRSQQELFVQIMDYTDTAAERNGYASGVEMLQRDLISGKIPDIIVVPNAMDSGTLPIEELFVDLYPLLEQDVGVNREDLVTGVLKACETSKGTLPTIVPSYGLLTVVGSSRSLGDTVGWSWQEYERMTKGTEIPILGMERSLLLYYMLQMGGDTLLSYDNAAAALDTPEFVQMLTESKDFPADSVPYSSQDPKPLFSSRKALTLVRFINDWSTIRTDVYNFDGDIVYKGFPSDNSGSAFTFSLRLGITRECEHPEAAWAFIGSFLTPEYQRHLKFSFPLRRDALYEQANSAKQPVMYPSVPSYFDVQELTEAQRQYWTRGLSEEETQQIVNLIEATDTLYQYDGTIYAIVSEEAEAFYNGVRTAEEAAALIQNRVQTYLAEQG